MSKSSVSIRWNPEPLFSILREGNCALPVAQAKKLASAHDSSFLLYTTSYPLEISLGIISNIYTESSQFSAFSLLQPSLEPPLFYLELLQ